VLLATVTRATREGLAKETLKTEDASGELKNLGRRGAGRERKRSDSSSLYKLYKSSRKFRNEFGTLRKKWQEINLYI